MNSAFESRVTAAEVSESNRRRRIVRLTVYALGGLSAFSIVAAGAMWLGPQDGTDAPARQEVLFVDDAEHRRADELEWTKNYLLQVDAVKYQAVEDLLQRRLTLLEAAAMFRNLHEDNAGYITQLQVIYPNCSDTERYCRGVIVYVCNRLEGKAEGTDLTARLEGELASYLRLGLPSLPDQTS
jgi:hypothetical protein